MILVVDRVKYKHVCILRPPRVDPIVAARGAACDSSPRDALLDCFLVSSIQVVIQMRYDGSRFADLQLDSPSLDMSHCKNSAEKKLAGINYGLRAVLRWSHLLTLDP